MKIAYSKQFTKNYKKRILHTKHHNQFKKRILIFQKDPRHPLLKDHALKGAMKEFRAFSITGDIRVIYEQTDKHTVKLIDIGTHNQVYTS